jgi:hypothetical protein
MPNVSKRLEPREERVFRLRSLTIELTPEFADSALKYFEPWRLGNDVLYQLCEKYPKHDRVDVIIAKFWLIGRSYAAAVERRKIKEEGAPVGDDFYTEILAKRILDSEIDFWFEELLADRDDIYPMAVKIHKRLTCLLHGITKQYNRSLASKYLHFHFPNIFYIYDTRASGGLRKILGSLQKVKFDKGEFDINYAPFYGGCETVRERLQTLLKREVTPREVDCVLVKAFAAS